MPAVKNRFIIPAFMFFISLAITFYLAKYLIPQFLITAYIVGFITVHWKKTLLPKGKAIVGIMGSFPLYVFPAWAVTGNPTLALLLGTLWSVSIGLTILVAIVKTG